jgi:hypothetical protein
LRAAATALAPSTTTEFDRDGQAAARTVTAMIWAAFLVDLFQFRPNRLGDDAQLP